MKEEETGKNQFAKNVNGILRRGLNFSKTNREVSKERQRIAKARDELLGISSVYIV